MSGGGIPAPPPGAGAAAGPLRLRIGEAQGYSAPLELTLVLTPFGQGGALVASRDMIRLTEYEQDADQVTFCQRVTAEQYDQERRGTSGSLLSLLDTIIGDTRMSKKDKIKRLRQVS